MQSAVSSIEEYSWGKRLFKNVMFCIQGFFVVLSLDEKSQHRGMTDDLC